MIGGEIAHQLRLRGHDVIAVQELHGLWGTKDQQLLTSVAWQQGRAIVTDNVRDFVPIHRALVSGGDHHAGIILASSSRLPRSKATIGRWVAALGAHVRSLPPGATLDDTYVWLPA